jgi:hypothetical protein
MKKFCSYIFLMIAFILVVCISCVPQFSLPSPAVLETNSPSSGTSTLKPTRIPGSTSVPKATRPANTPQNNQGSDAAQNMTFDIPTHPIDVILGRPTRDSITMSIMANQNVEIYIEYDFVTDAFYKRTPRYNLVASQPVEILVNGLQANTAYAYRVRYRFSNSGDFDATDAETFFTQRSPGSSFTFSIQADSHLDSNSSQMLYAQTLASESADKSDFMIDLGDTFMTDKYKPYTNAQSQYLAQRFFLSQIGKTAPLFLVLGNHDGEGAPHGQENEMSTWSVKLRTKYFPNPIPDGFYTGNSTPDKIKSSLQDYYAWEWGDALFIVLDPYWFTPSQRGTTADLWNPTLGKAQYQWLKATLEASQAKWKFVFIHQLIGGADKNGRGGVEVASFYEWGGNNADGSYGFNEQRLGWGIPIHQLLINNHVTAVFHGHDHLFARQELDGIVYQEVPQPAADGSNGTKNAAEYGYHSGDILNGSGHLRVSVSLEGVTVDFIRSVINKPEELAFSYSVK